MKGRKHMLSLFIVTVVFSILLLDGCGGFSTLPKEKISESDKAVAEAKESNASVNAPTELKAAEDKLAKAKAAFRDKDYDVATRLAEQASVDADYARAKGASEKAKKEAEDLRQNIKTLRQDIEGLSKEITLQGGK